MVRKIWIFVFAILLMALPGMADAADSPFSAEPERLSLDLCLELASQNSQTVKAAEKKVEIAAAAVTEARGAYWPKLDYSLPTRRRIPCTLMMWISARELPKMNPERPFP
jgi:outer membrane protein TolC